MHREVYEQVLERLFSQVGREDEKYAELDAVFVPHADPHPLEVDLANLRARVAGLENAILILAERMNGFE